LTDAILILGGYGNFGKRIAHTLVKDGYRVIIAGRNNEKAQAVINTIKTEFPNAYINTAIFDAEKELSENLKTIVPKILINTIGPFQSKDYDIAKTCIINGINYIDLADGRDFVTQFETLNEISKENGVIAIAGASTVPALSSAVLENYKNIFSQIDYVKYGIAPGQKAERGLATTKGILGYVGKQLKPAYGSNELRYGWQDIYLQKLPEIGFRWMANCDIPDLDLLPPKYGIKRIEFGAGLELGFMHLGLWGLSWLVRLGLHLKLENYANPMLLIADWFNFIGTDDGGMFVEISGKDNGGAAITVKWAIIAKNGDGPQIPTIPAVILAERICDGEFKDIGATACVALISLEDYVEKLSDFQIEAFSNMA
jgi:hypothetical protein